MVHSNILTTPDGKTPAFGPPHWVAGAIGNSTWSGPRLRDVLRSAQAQRTRMFTIE